MERLLIQSYLTYRFSNGSLADEKKCRKLADLEEEIIEQSEDESDFDGSLGDYFSENFNRNLSVPKYNDIDQTFADQFTESIHKDYNSFYASSSWYDISVQVNAGYHNADGNQHLSWKDKGYKTAIDFITKKLPDPAKYLNVESKIRFGKEVTSINWTDPNGKVQIECADGTKISTTHVIFTASLGVLKNRHESLFTPNLPPKKISAIENIAFGAIGKIFLEFSVPFWPKESFSGYSFLWQDEHITEAKSSNREWVLGISGFYPVDAFPNLIEAFVTNASHIKTFENLSDANLVNDCMWLLEKFLERSLFKPTQMIRTKWLTNNHFLGTYSYFSMNTQTFNATSNDLAESLYSSNGKPIILFAGEATDLKYPSYAHGAVSSGSRAANELAKFYDKQ